MTYFPVPIGRTTRHSRSGHRLRKAFERGIRSRDLPFRIGYPRCSSLLSILPWHCTNFFPSGESSIIMNSSDENLVQAFREGNDIAFVNLYNLHKRSVYLFCLKMLEDSDEAKDIVQGVFLKIYERRQQLNHSGRFRAWLF